MEQPILGVSSLYDENLSQFPGFAHAAHLLDHRVITQIVAGAVAKILRPRERFDFLRFNCRHGQRLFTEDMFTRSECGFRDWSVKTVGSADMNGRDIRIAENALVMSFNALDMEGFGHAACRFNSPAGNR